MNSFRGCPQARLPQVIAGNPQIRNASTIIFAVIGFALTMTGSIMQLVSLYSGVPTKHVCTMIGLGHTSCDLVSSAMEALPCCDGATIPNENQVWSLSTGFSPAGNIGPHLAATSISQKDTAKFFKKFFESGSTAQKLLQQQSGSLFGLKDRVMPFQMMSADFASNNLYDTSLDKMKTYSKKLSEIMAAKFQLTNGIYGGLSVGGFLAVFYCGIFSLLFMISSFLNMTVICRQGFARANLAFGGTVFAILLMSYWSMAADVATFLPLVTTCSNMKSSSNSLFAPASFFTGVTGSGAALLGVFPCRDVTCAYELDSKTQAHECKTKNENPVVDQLTKNASMFLDGQWIFVAGLAVTCAILANIDKWQDDRSPPLMRKQSFAMSSSFQ
jgi:hypothetical protein